MHASRHPKTERVLTSPTRIALVSCLDLQRGIRRPAVPSQRRLRRRPRAVVFVLRTAVGVRGERVQLGVCEQRGERSVSFFPWVRRSLAHPSLSRTSGYKNLGGPRFRQGGVDTQSWKTQTDGRAGGRIRRCVGVLQALR